MISVGIWWKLEMVKGTIVKVVLPESLYDMVACLIIALAHYKNLFVLLSFISLKIMSRISLTERWQKTPEMGSVSAQTKHRYSQSMLIVGSVSPAIWSTPSINKNLEGQVKKWLWILWNSISGTRNLPAKMNGWSLGWWNEMGLLEDDVGHI